MRDVVKAEIVYFEVTVVEWSSTNVGGSLALGFSPPSFPLEGVLVGGTADDSRSYSFTPVNGQVLCADDTIVDRWRWVEPAGAISTGDVFGCGLRLDTQEIFFCKNGQLLGTAFSSIPRPEELHPTISFNTDCKLLANLGATATTTTKHANFNFRFHSLDCDNLMSAFEWFEPLSQVYGVMKALMDPARPDEVDACDVTTEENADATVAAPLPDEFMLSADNFLSDISEDVCKDNRGWGWIGNRALWHNGSKQRGTYGDKFKTGDIVRLTLDLRRGTLSYALNGKDLGVAFGPGGTGPKLEGTFYPGFALYNQRDSIDLIGGHRVEDGGLDSGLPRTGSGLASGEDSYYSEEEEDVLAESGGEDSMGDGSVPNFRMELGIALSQMGFPMECHRATAVSSKLVNEMCETRAEALLSCDPLRMAPEEFIPTEEQLLAFPTSLAFIDFSAQDDRSLLARGARALRGVVFQHVKLAWWLGVLKEQQAPAAARPEIEVDRHRAHDALELSELGDPLASGAGERDSVFAQTFEQLHGLQPALLRGADRAFKCQFVGEFGDDFGGLYRECLAQLSSELQTRTPLLPVFRPCPNALMNTGENRELFVPNSHLRTHPRRVQMAEFLGKLAGVAVRTKTPLDLNLPPVVWKLLVGQQVMRHDIEAIHKGCFQVVDTIANLAAHGITEAMFDEIVDASFTVLSSTCETVELVPGGRHLHVTWEDRDDYARAIETYRLNEYAPVCRDVSRGLATILPAPTLGLFSWHELRTLVCGKASVDVALLRRRTIYGDGCQATDPHIAYFWDVLTAFSDEQKSSFLRFVWGRSRLPTHAADFTQDFKISGLPKAAGRADMLLFHRSTSVFEPRGHA
ncbi:hypothetical protein G195_003129 [Phytophthora kernoviae 00238/432]|uniref:B30.2/SPRY domain-containing protein n=1 Tax=Phytophthora kernoviae 00238/432 TaxID=1284355 RepID=A0A8J4SA81_9STRA|nr:hypothetical protein G195_003129 [Phytophthora kernoviae 00238/432]